jgi:hypothetical protein
VIWGERRKFGSCDEECGWSDWGALHYEEGLQELTSGEPIGLRKREAEPSRFALSIFNGVNGWLQDGERQDFRGDCDIAWIGVLGDH